MTLLIGIVEKFLLHWPFDHWYPLFTPKGRFLDFIVYRGRLEHFGQADLFTCPGFLFTYPAPLAVVFHLFYLFDWRALEIYFDVFFIISVGAGAFLVFALHRRGLRLPAAAGFAGASFLLSYPFWFLADRANIEIINWLTLVLGVTCFYKKRWFGAATFFGLAAAFKIYPFVYIALLLGARRYAATAWSLIVAVGVTVGSLLLLGPPLRASAAGIVNGLAAFGSTNALKIRLPEIGFDHSLFALVKQLALATAKNPSALLDAYLVIAAAFGLGLYAWKIRKLPRANQLIALTVCAIVLPPVSSDYTLINLYIPWAVLVLIAVSGNQCGGRGVMLSLVCMAILMAPESYLFYHGVRIAGQFKAVVLLALLAVSLIYPIDESTAPAKTSDGVSPPAIPPP